MMIVSKRTSYIYFLKILHALVLREFLFPQYSEQYYVNFFKILSFVILKMVTKIEFICLCD
jgi:hypothetical protein